jgi:hypothetical protein
MDMPQKVHLTPTTSAMPDLLARQIDAMVKETAKVVSKEGAANANHYEVEVLMLDFVIEHLTIKRDTLRAVLNDMAGRAR